MDQLNPQVSDVAPKTSNIIPLALPSRLARIFPGNAADLLDGSQTLVVLGVA